MNDVLKAIAERRSIRNYSNAQVTDEQLQLLRDAALQAPSAVNRQPYHFTFVRNSSLLDEFKKDAGEILASLRPNFPKDMDILRGAPMVCFIFRDTESIWSPIDSGIAVENIALAAHSIGLGSVILGMPYDVFAQRGDKWYQKLECPDGMCFAIAIGIGTPVSGKEPHSNREGLVSVL